MRNVTRYRVLALCAAAMLPAVAQAGGPMLPAGQTVNATAAPAPQAAAPQPTAAAPQTAARTPVVAESAAQPATAPGPSGPQAPITVAAWGFSQNQPNGGSAPPTQAASVGHPLYVWMTLAGGQAAVDQLNNGGRIAVEVHWTTDNPNGHAPGLTTNLDVGRPGIAAAWAGQVAKTGHFEWHSWTRKDSLSPGRWTVSLTDPSGQPIACGQGPCQLSIDVS